MNTPPLTQRLWTKEELIIIYIGLQYNRPTHKLGLYSLVGPIGTSTIYVHQTPNFPLTTRNISQKWGDKLYITIPAEILRGLAPPPVPRDTPLFRIRNCHFVFEIGLKHYSNLFTRRQHCALHGNGRSLKRFLRASAMLKHVIAIGLTSVRPSVCPSVRHTLAPYQNG